MSKQHPRDFRERAVPLVTESHGDHDTEWSSIREVAMRFCVGPEKVRKCFRQAEI
jgi:transposase